MSGSGVAASMALVGRQSPESYLTALAGDVTNTHVSADTFSNIEVLAGSLGRERRFELFRALC